MVLVMVGVVLLLWSGAGRMECSVFDFLQQVPLISIMNGKSNAITIHSISIKIADIALNIKKIPIIAMVSGPERRQVVSDIITDRSMKTGLRSTWQQFRRPFLLPSQDLK